MATHEYQPPPGPSQVAVAEPFLLALPLAPEPILHRKFPQEPVPPRKVVPKSALPREFLQLPVLPPRALPELVPLQEGLPVLVLLQ